MLSEFLYLYQSKNVVHFYLECFVHVLVLRLLKNYNSGPLSIEKRAAGGPLLEAWQLSGKALASGARGPRFDPSSRR